MFGAAYAQDGRLRSRKRIKKGMLAAFASLAVALCTLVFAASPAWATDSSITGVALDGDLVVYTEGTVDQTSVPDDGLAGVIKWRQDALNDTNVKLQYGNTYVTVREYLAKTGISESDYLNPKWSNALERIAVQRAVENRDYNRIHIRLTGGSCWTATYNGYSSNHEVLAWAADVSGAITMWSWEKDDYIKEVNGQPHGVTGHYVFLIDPQYKEYGFGACLGTQAGEAISSRLSNDSTHFNLKGTFEFPVGVSNVEVNQGVNMNFPTTMDVGYTFTPTATLKFTTVDQAIVAGIDTYQIHGTWTSSDSSVLSVSSDGTVKAVGAGTATLTLASQGRTWTQTVQVTRTQKISSEDVARIENQKYTGSAVTPAVKVTVGGKTLTQGTDYIVSYANNIEMGEATVTITGIGSYKGTVKTYFTIYGDFTKVQIDDIHDQLYAGKPVTPSVTVRFAGKVLVPGRDYDIDYYDNNEVGYGKVLLTGVNAGR